ncbi:response regulator [bacterium]|nr:response regulator [bacterium]
MNKDKIRILIVDDDMFISDLLHRFLTKEGYDVVLASSGPAAISLLKEKPVDLAVIDLMLDDMDGITLINEFKRLSFDIIMIMMTGHPTLETALEAMKIGVQDYLIKPFKLEQLADVIRRCLQEQENQQEMIRLRQELQDAKAQIQKYESMLRHGHRILPAAESHDEGFTSTGISAYRKKTIDLEERQAKLEELHNNSVISDSEFERRLKRLKAKKSEAR